MLPSSKAMYCCVATQSTCLGKTVKAILDSERPWTVILPVYFMCGTHGFELSLNPRPGLNVVF